MRGACSARRWPRPWSTPSPVTAGAADWWVDEPDDAALPHDARPGRRARAATRCAATCRTPIARPRSRPGAFDARDRAAVAGGQQPGLRRPRRTGRLDASTTLASGWPRTGSIPTGFRIHELDGGIAGVLLDEDPHRDRSRRRRDLRDRRRSGVPGPGTRASAHAGGPRPMVDRGVAHRKPLRRRRQRRRRARSTSSSASSSIAPRGGIAAHWNAPSPATAIPRTREP